MKRYSDIQELLSDCDLNIGRIQSKYSDASRDEQQLKVMRPLVKSIMEHLRAVLDYSAQDIWESYTRKKNRPSFPYGATESIFRVSVKKGLPGIDEQRPELLALIESIQPFTSGDSWISDLCKYTNINKHDRLVNQERVNSPQNSIALGGMGALIRNSEGVVFEDCIFDDSSFGVSASFSNNTPASEIRRQMGLRVEVIKTYDWIEFRLDESASDVLDLLVRSRLKIGQFVEELNAML